MIFLLKKLRLLSFVLYGLPILKLFENIYFQLRLVSYINALDKFKCLHPVSTFSNNKPTFISLFSKAETASIYSNVKSRTNTTRNEQHYAPSKSHVNESLAF